MSYTLATKTVEATTLVELLRWRALHHPERHAYTFLRQGETVDSRLTYGDLDREARTIASLLQQKGATAKPVLLLHAPGTAYVGSFFGCLYAGAIAVPAYPPASARMMPRIQAIVEDTQATIVLTTSNVLSDVQRYFAHVPDLQYLEWIATDTIPAYISREWEEPVLTADSLAFLQYTSGSTSTPKGVMVTHSNLLHNLEWLVQYCEQRFENSSHMVTWLPTYHDMGLIGGILFPMYGGYPSTMMSPFAFLQRPYRWLQAVSRTRATISISPNFGYDLCIHKLTAEQKATLDLSNWEVAALGSEPIRSETLDQFAETFSGCGFRRSAFFPGYGLAEATLLVASGGKNDLPLVLALDKAALEQGHVRAPSDAGTSRNMVGYDHFLQEQKVLIVHPETLMPCTNDEVGEIWTSGPSRAAGYWQKPEETDRTFNAYTTTGEGPFLRTGDLGFLHDGALFVTGRLKDLIVIRGRNYYPQDIELTVENCHPAIRKSCCAVFSIDVDGREELIVLAEIEARYSPAREATEAPLANALNRKLLNGQELIKTIRREIAGEHDLQVYKVALLKTGAILKTSSGKVQRRACRAAFLNGELSMWDEEKTCITE
jgi:acyl-CoA synthetase (AMP-forming)/AMP-acid ligase II